MASREILTAFAIPLAAIVIAIYVPKKITLDQQFASLTEQYRSTEMGYAIYSLFSFYVNDCGNNPDNIHKKYVERFNREIKEPPARGEKIDPSKTLHFQRRLVAYFFWDLSRLYFESFFPSLKKKQLVKMVEAKERQLINLVLQMSEANAECFARCENITEPPDDDVPMNQSLKRLYEKTEELA